VRDGMLVVDAHCHIEPEGHDMFGRTGRVTTEEQLVRMDMYGIDLAIVIAHAWAGWTIPQYRALHDLIAKEVAKQPDRLVGFCWADPLLGQDAVVELRRCVEDLGYRGLKLHPVYQRFQFDEPVVYPLIELARELKIPVTAHLDLRVPGCEPWRMIHLAQLYPEVTFIMAHMGRDVRALQDLSLARAAARVPNVLLEGSSTTTDAYGTFQGPAEVMGPDRVLFATDAGPFHHPAINMLKIDLLSMSRDWKEQILGGNALRVLGRSPDTVGRAPDHRRGVYVTAMGTVEYPTPALIQ
jgi:predicted TIM-barrel fold metal-dependent hydrolase